MRRIAVVDYDLGNLFSVLQALKKLGSDARVVRDPAELSSFDGVVLPGVGAFGKAMLHLKESGFDQAIQGWVKAGRPFLGICLGMQLVMEQSEEFGTHLGLGLVPGLVQKFPEKLNGKSVRIPRMGWAELNPSIEHPALVGMSPQEDVYFVHSYHVVLKDPRHELAWSVYDGFRYTSAIAHENIWAYQFHPEKSGEAGLRLLANWLDQR